MSKSISISLLLALAALALFVAGCGGDDNEATGSANESGPPSIAEFIERAEEVCFKAKRARYFEARKYRSEHRKELEALEGIPGEEKIISAVVLPSIQKEAQELDALETPKGEEKKIKAMIVEIEKGVKRAEKDPSRATLEVPSRYAFRRVGLMFRAYGITDCRNIA